MWFGGFTDLDEREHVYDREETVSVPRPSRPFRGDHIGHVGASRINSRTGLVRQQSVVVVVLV